MKDFNYYSGVDIESPSHKTRFDFTTISAILKNIDGVIVDTITEPLDTTRVKQLTKAGLYSYSIRGY